MRSNLLIGFILALSVSAGFAQIPQSPNKINSNGRRDGVWTILYNEDWKVPQKGDTAMYYRIITFLDGKPDGVIRDYYLSGKIQWEGKLKSIDPGVYDDGQCSWYYENGNKKSTSFYLNEKRNGAYQMFFSNGKVSESGVFKNGVRDNLITYYHPNGEVFSERIFHQDSLWDFISTKDSIGHPLKTGDLIRGCGSVIEYFRSGKKSGKGNYKNGVRDGSWTFYFENGKISSKGNYKDALKDGYWKEYQTSKAWCEGNYIKGKSEGKWICYGVHGNILAVGEVKNDEQQGIWKYYNEYGDWCEGVVIAGKQELKWVCWYSTYEEKGECFYTNGKMEGNSIEWFRNKKVSREGAYKNDLEQGFWKEFNEDGDWIEGNYMEGKAEGVWKEYKSNGKYKESFFYKNGVKQKH
ncbi:MAG: hypothetical protein NTW16_16275 [Bacteroidetes bacterium]|nr:hypothetical protein [Bacteroidota bacterium]